MHGVGFCLWLAVYYSALALSLATDLNRRPADYKSAALPTELARHYGGVSSKAAVIVLIVHLPLELDIVSNGPAYFRDVLAANVFKFRKVEDGCVDIYFYDWHF